MIAQKIRATHHERGSRIDQRKEFYDETMLIRLAAKTGIAPIFLSSIFLSHIRIEAECH